MFDSLEAQMAALPEQPKWQTLVTEPPRWEYKEWWLGERRFGVPWLNAQGADGWELAGVVREAGGYQVWLKRLVVETGG